MEPECESQPQSESGLVLEPPSSKKSDRAKQKRRRRRRSSARFLRLSGRTLEDDDEEEEEEEHETDKNLGDMYKRAIRMNAENRINASNSWNLRLIENIDKFLEEEDVESSETSRSVDTENKHPNEASTKNQNDKTQTGGKEKRVNFTKASCTLDASVKIYSYRVDDVHLSSYKVLANLNRTENNDGKAKKKQKDTQSTAELEGGDGDMLDEDEDDEGPSKAPQKSANTLENNVANINMNKLDSAFDIDPLFHKMSKTFDEGGAKGLLLVNLSVGDKGCNIVFDSKAECEEEVMEQDPGRSEGMVDISSLLSKLDSIEATHSSIESMSLVPQLESLRDQYAELSEEGFMEKKVRVSKRYACTQEEEKEADKSIHEEAMERSRASIGVLGRSFASEQQDGGYNDDDDAPMFAPDDFGGGGDDAEFDAFIALDQSENRFSGISFRESLESDPNNKSQADVMLDAICSGDVLGGGGEYQFFDSKALEMSMSENQWAGSQHVSFSHWKRSESRRKRQEKQAKEKTEKAKTPRKSKKKNALVDLTSRPVLADILRKPPKGKRGSNPLQMSKTMIASKSKDFNMLPPDAGVSLDTLTSLYMRPTMVKPVVEKPSSKNKTVCFDADVETFGFGDDSFGGHDDGPGFLFADDDGGDNNHDQPEDDFVIEELKGVRKVDTKSVRVGYATIAKKVDVRRLKRDLWSGIEVGIGASEADKPDDADALAQGDAPVVEEEEPKDGLSFQDAVRDMEESKTQVDVTLPFYFICVLHLANEKGLKLESTGLQDFVIRNDTSVTAPSV